MQLPERQRRPRSRRRPWWLAAAAAYVAVLVGLTWLAFAAAVPMRKAVTSAEFQAAIRDVRNPVTEADLPRILPGIPIYPGARLDPLRLTETTRSAREGAPRIHLSAPASPSQIRAFYRSHMAGWELDRESSDEDTLIFRRGDEWCRVYVMPDLPLGLGEGERSTFTVRYDERQEGER